MWSESLNQFSSQSMVSLIMWRMVDSYKVLKKLVVIEKNVEAKTIAEKEVLQRTRHPFILVSSALF